MSDGENQTGIPSPDDATEYFDALPFPVYDAKLPWLNGPLLRKDSFTARQLYHLTPKSMDLESRVIFIGNFQPNWVCTNLPKWRHAIDRHVARLSSQKLHSMSDGTEVLDSITPSEQNRIAELNLATKIGEETNTNLQTKTKKHVSLLRAMRRRRNKFRHQKLKTVKLDQNQLNAGNEDTDVASARRQSTAGEPLLMLNPSSTPLNLDDSRPEEEWETDTDEPQAATESITRTEIDPVEGAMAGSEAGTSTAGTTTAGNTAAGASAAGTTEAGSSSESVSSSEFYDCPDSFVASTSSRADDTDFGDTSRSQTSNSLASPLSSQESFDCKPPLSIVNVNTRTGEVSGAPSTAESLFNQKYRKNSVTPKVKVTEPSGTTTKSVDDDEPQKTPSSPLPSADGEQSVEEEEDEEGEEAPRGLSAVVSKFKSRRRSSGSIGDISLARKTTANTQNLEALTRRHSHAYSIASRIHESTSGAEDLLKNGETSLARLRSHVRLRRSSQRQKATKIHHGRFLVQERKTKAAHPLVNEVENPMGTTLLTRWKECALLAKQTDDPERPLVLYFYECVDPKKLQRRAKRRWRRTRAYKIKIDCNYRFNIYSPLDMSLAVWRQQMPGDNEHHHHHSHIVHNNEYDNPNRRYHHHHHPGKRGKGDDENKGSTTKILIIHSKSLTEIMDLAFLLTSATRGAPWLHSRVSSQINVPSCGATIKIDSQRRLQDVMNSIHQAKINQNSLVSYCEVLKPAISETPALRRYEEKLLKAIEQLPVRLRQTPAPLPKLGLVWMSPGMTHCPLWLSSIATSFFPVLWISSIMDSASNLALVKPEPKCNAVSDMDEPPPVEGYCVCANMRADDNANYLKPTLGRHRIGPHYFATFDHYLLFIGNQDAESPIMAGEQTTLEKLVQPFEPDADGQNIRWISESKCLEDIDHHDMIAKMEHDRRRSLVHNARGLINLLFFRDIKVSTGTEVSMRGYGELKITMNFETPEIAAAWARRLSDISGFWKKAYKSQYIRQSVGPFSNFTITPFLQNRGLVYSGQLFVKMHRFATFKSYEVLLTSEALILFRIDQKKRPPAHPTQNIPSSSMVHRQHKTIPLKNSYVYTGPSTGTVFLNRDEHFDASNPGSRALPRVYEDGWISQESETERCFVLWQCHKPHFTIFQSETDGIQLAFLASDKIQRDRWAMAIRYAQTRLVTKTVDAADDIYIDEPADLENDSEEEI